MNIPKQLENNRFLRVLHKTKRPFENGWQKKPYTYQEIQQYFPKENYGIINGAELRVLDDDSPKKGLITLYYQNFPKTMRVRDHIYFKFDNKNSSKIIFNHPTLEFNDGNGGKTNHLGELQGEGTMVVGPGSTHPSGEKYELVDDLPIVTISYDKFMEVFGNFIKKDIPMINRERKVSNWSGSNISDIPIEKIVNIENMKYVGNESYQGSHPEHGSVNGMNFRVNTQENTWVCFRCNNKNTRKKGDPTRGCGGPAELIAVMEGIKECCDVGSKCFSVEQGQKLIKIAREKYGLKIPVVQDLGEVKGWAKSISIVKLAKRNNMEKCPKCNNPFKFTDSHGMYWCDSCKYGGGLKKFANLITERDMSI